jgi:hypothetical protein
MVGSGSAWGRGQRLSNGCSEGGLEELCTEHRAECLLWVMGVFSLVLGYAFPQDGRKLGLFLRIVITLGLLKVFERTTQKDSIFFRVFFR